LRSLKHGDCGKGSNRFTRKAVLRYKMSKKREIKYSASDVPTVGQLLTRHAMYV